MRRGKRRFHFCFTVVFAVIRAFKKDRRRAFGLLILFCTFAIILTTMEIRKIRNFCIIAHIDHGKSTLADRFLELTHTITDREKKEQFLDSMDLERERGITIKMQPVSMRWIARNEEFILNLIDTPGHVDFTYEVSRALAAVEGAILVVDAVSGIQAQTLAHLYVALEQNLAIVPVVNKIDLRSARVERVSSEIAALLGITKDGVIPISAKTGKNVEAVLQAVIERIPPPSGAVEIGRASWRERG